MTLASLNVSYISSPCLVGIAPTPVYRDTRQKDLSQREFRKQLEIFKGKKIVDFVLGEVTKCIPLVLPGEQFSAFTSSLNNSNLCFLFL